MYVCMYVCMYKPFTAQICVSTAQDGFVCEILCSDVTKGAAKLRLQALPGGQGAAASPPRCTPAAARDHICAALPSQLCGQWRAAAVTRRIWHGLVGYSVLLAITTLFRMMSVLSTLNGCASGVLTCRRSCCASWSRPPVHTCRIGFVSSPYFGAS